MKTLVALLFGCLALSSLAQVTGPGAGPPGVTNPAPTLTNTLPVTSFSIPDMNEVVWLEDSTPQGAVLSAALTMVGTGPTLFGTAKGGLDRTRAL